MLELFNKGFDGGLTLFAVSDKSQGLGIGKNLLNLVKDYWVNNNTKQIHLFTDDKCNYGFYDYNNFKRIDNQLVNVDGEVLDVYIYTYNLN